MKWTLISVAMAAALAMTACGGKVVVDGNGGIGGAGGAGGAGGGSSSTPVLCPSEASWSDPAVMDLVGKACIPDQGVCASNDGCGGCSVTCKNGVWSSTNADLCFFVGGTC
jgi:hypothetical protein